MLATWVLTAAAPAGGATTAPERPSTVTIAFVPQGTELSELAELPEIAPGIMSPSLGAAPAAQTYLDISQGDRLFSSLYPRELPSLGLAQGPAEISERAWRAVAERAREAPASIVPGLLASTVGQSLGGAVVDEARGPGAYVTVDARSARLVAADRSGEVAVAGPCSSGRCGGLVVDSTALGGLPVLIGRLRGDDLLIVVERPRSFSRSRLAIGIAGRGFGGNLTSDSTRSDGYVVSTDIAATTMRRLGIEVPDEIGGREIRSGAERDVDAILDFDARLSEIPERRDGVIVSNALIWLAAALAAALWQGRASAARALAIFAAAAALVPAVLLLTAALDPSDPIERLIVGAGAPLAAVALLGAAARLDSIRSPALAAFALAAAISVVATAFDVIAGSPLTARSLLGPNPGLGVRFYGIGNELEASLSVLLIAAVGAGIAAVRPSARAPAAFGLAAVAGVIAFAPGSFGADVGAAITIPVGAAVAIVVVAGLGRARALLVLAAPVIALAALIVIDLLSGGDAHLSRSVLEAGGLDRLGEVIERRTRLSARSFENRIDSPFLIATLLGAGLAVARRERIRGWFEGRPAAGAALAGCAAATAVGTLANDSGSLLLMVGAAYTALYAGVCWASQLPPADRRAP